MTAPAPYDLRHGCYQDVLADVEVDAVICDPPFGARTHEGQAGGNDGHLRGPIVYQHWTAVDVSEFVRFWSERTRGWMVAITCSDLFPAWRESYEAAGRISFHPLPLIMPNMTCRLTGDGPSSEAVYALVARPRTRAMARWGTLPGWYYALRGVHKSLGPSVGRGKPLDLMRKIVSDYSRPGDLVCDPTAGYGSTLAAAIQKGRRAIGAECEADVYAEARRRLDLVMAGPADLFDPRSARPGTLDL